MTRVDAHLAAAVSSREFESEALSAGFVESLLDSLPRTPFYTKDKSLRFVGANAAMLELCGAPSRDALIGKSGADFFPAAVAARHEAYERRVITTLRPLHDQLDHCIPLSGPPVWLLLNHWPLIRDGQAVGIVCIARALEDSRRAASPYERLAVVVDAIRADISVQLDVKALADRVGISVSQLERDFVELFGLPPRRYQIKLRIDSARDQLRSGAAIADIAYACGYCDQSAFTRRFRAEVGMSPSEFRRLHADIAAPPLARS